VAIPHKQGKRLRKKAVVFKLIIGSLERVECNPRPLGRHNVKVGKFHLAEPQDKNRVSLVLLLSVINCVRKRSLQAT
jgi:hypothetical protein